MDIFVISVAMNIQTGSRRLSNHQRALVTIAIVLIIIAVVFVAVYLNLVAPFQIKILTVDDSFITMDYFLKRLLMSNSAALPMLETLTAELFIENEASSAPYNILVTDSEIDKYLAKATGGEQASISSGELKEWIRQRSRAEGLSIDQFRRLARISLQTQKFRDYFVTQFPKDVPQVHLFLIALENKNDADLAAARLSAGEDFRTLARELNIDLALRESGGDAGWMPKEALPAPLAGVVFNDLAPGEAGPSIFINEHLTVIPYIYELSQSRPVAADLLQRIGETTLRDWIKDQYNNHTVQFNGLNGKSYDSETDAWVNWQISRMKERRGNMVAP